MDVTAESLAAVLRGRIVDVIDSPGVDPETSSRAYLAFPDDLAENLLDEIEDLKDAEARRDG
jgi:hypothetical protein